MQKKHIYLFIGLFTIDQMSKFLFTSLLDYHEKCYLIPNFFAFTNERNMGAAWGMYHGSLKFFTFATIAMFLILLVFYRYVKENDTLTRCGIVCILAGSFANMFDRFLFHYVRDFIFINIRFLQSPIFNFADIIIWVGVGIIIYSIFQDEKKALKESSASNK